MTDLLATTLIQRNQKILNFFFQQPCSQGRFILNQACNRVCELLTLQSERSGTTQQNTPVQKDINHTPQELSP